ncbi:MAG: cation:proton antiporter [Deltaproteobacteria bacterium]|jgi:multicomponent Na+:H+ antiporter subunit F|nr:cation:proton antiporter [Deltaproteobacteria bacterium]MBW2534953.1 cation:proton antiporter [Deltaproteobacteria bacterium]
MTAALLIAKGLLVVAALVTFGRFVRGPTVFDRIAAVEVLLLTLVGYLVLEARGSSARAYVDGALALALLSFIGTVFLAHYLSRRELHD